MPLQNRVTPFGALERTEHRGLLMGNRGSIHREREIVSQWKLRAWIICDTQFRGWKRDVMPPGRWTALFFLDEAVALAAGHRPCAYCRRPAFRAYLDAAGYPLAKVLDPVLHAERMSIRKGVRETAQLSDLPDGAFVTIDTEAWIIFHGHRLRWSHAGYSNRTPIQQGEAAEVLTPAVSLTALRNGFQPVLHPSLTT